MNCWKTVDINKEFGPNRINLLSLLTGLMSFLIIYLPFSIIHGTHELKDHGFVPLMMILFLLPAMHRLMHILPLVLLYKRVRVTFKFRKRFTPTFTYQCTSKLSKQTSIIMALAPTFLITMPALMMSFIFPGYFAYLVLFAAVNIGLSFSDFLYLNQFARAPRRCVISNSKSGYDILIQRPEL
ncbi:DUF3267 domain-containing protein [Halobacillus amylolyticus]|uniref:DUF3267 domain-containing protein n=1 Tax=Halobacillus amylolyticus TaxID=2932259 RepID=A0ABY4HE95_9BACI|nr:DUF3267 domain-containing protein [Halobacillus amylolyticus]UOR13210.1 DUF3267 domain-containing protein [Halobacillus amylolyticus]